MFRTFDFVADRTDDSKKNRQTGLSVFCVRLCNYERDLLLSSAGRDIDGWIFFLRKFQKMNFSKKWGWCAQYRSLPFSGLVRLGTAHIFIMVHFLPLNLHQSEKRKKPHFGTFPDLWRHSRVKRPHLIRNMADRSDKTSFSRTHRFGCELQTSDAGWYSKLQKDNNCAAHVRNGIGYLTVPKDRLFAHGV